MTKPSYEERPMNRREAYLRGYEAGKRDTFEKMPYETEYELGERIRELDTELARVRGLLQRIRDKVSASGSHDDQRVNDYNHELLTLLDEKVTVEERHYEDGRIQRRIGNGEWEEVPNPSGKPLFAPPTFPQSSSLVSQGAESVHSVKLNTADKSELLPTQLPKEK